ncbi:MAG: carboxymuconolactone decarboxylase family protein [Mucilaginibacter sp.]|nr:carboxymuconolactone decarboxylase family protein [Mucilaginibacter sp.]
MSKRFSIEPTAYQAMEALENYLNNSGLDKKHAELIKIRASQINGCAYCINMHTKDARELGETEQRIYALNAWRETPFFSPEERAILAITENITNIQQGMSEKVFEEAEKVLDRHTISKVIMAAVGINAWNRIGIGTGMQPTLG